MQGTRKTVLNAVVINKFFWQSEYIVLNVIYAKINVP